MVVAAASLALAVAAGCGGGSAGGAGEHVATARDRGSFSVACAYSHSAGDDPIVHPGHHGMSHQHDFFGATTTGARSTAASLMAGGTTCRSVADRSAYWAPALLDPAGRAVTPTHVQAYYRTPVGTDARDVRPLPNGLEMIAGDAGATRAQDPAVVHWSCGVRGDASPVPRRCAGAGAELRLVLVFPQCWDGEHLRSADHVSHLARLPEAEGARRCPATHPVLLPETTVEVRYPAGPPPGEPSLASGPATGGHGDLLVAWDQRHLATEVDTCLHRNLRCDVTSEPERLDTAAGN